MKKALIGFLVVAAVLGGLLYWQLGKRAEAEDAPPGSSATIEGRQFDVSPRMAGRIDVIHVDEGDRVGKGQLLVELVCDQPEAALKEAEAALAIAQARRQQAVAMRDAAKEGIDIAARQTDAAGANVKATRSRAAVLQTQIESAQRSIGRLEKLRKGGGGTEQQLDDARTALAVLQDQQSSAEAATRAARAQERAVAGGEKAAESQVAVAEAGIVMADADILRAEAAVGRAQTAVGDCRVVAAADGTVQLRAFEPGEFVMPGARVLTVVDTDTVEATFYLPNEFLDAAAPGVEVRVVADALPDDPMMGRITHVSESAEFTPRNVQTRDDRDRLVYAVKVEIANPDGKLRPGMPAEIRLEEAP